MLKTHEQKKENMRSEMDRDAKGDALVLLLVLVCATLKVVHDITERWQCNVQRGEVEKKIREG